MIAILVFLIGFVIALYIVWLQTSPMQSRHGNTRGEHHPYPEM